MAASPLLAFTEQISSRLSGTLHFFSIGVDLVISLSSGLLTLALQKMQRLIQESFCPMSEQWRVYMRLSRVGTGATFNTSLECPWHTESCEVHEFILCSPTPPHTQRSPPREKLNSQKLNSLKHSSELQCFLQEAHRWVKRVRWGMWKARCPNRTANTHSSGFWSHGTNVPSPDFVYIKEAGN